MHETARTLASAIPNAELHALEGQSHEVSAQAIAPLWIEFFKD
jgi:hypothetical protein